MIIINISGPQGSGKTIAARIIKAALEAQGKVVLVANTRGERGILRPRPYTEEEVVCDFLIEDFQ